MIEGVLDGVSDRMDVIRSEGHQATMADDPIQGRKLLLAGEGDLSTPSSGETSPKHSLWIKAFGYHGDQDTKDNFDGYSATTAGLSLGTDTLLDNDWLRRCAHVRVDAGVP